MNRLDIEGSPHGAAQSETVVLAVPPEFNFTENLRYLNRSADEALYQVADGRVSKLLRMQDRLLLCQISEDEAGLQLTFPYGNPDEAMQAAAADYVRHWFDLHTDLAPFYELAQEDALLSNVVRRFYGLRLMGVADLFEALCWAIIGQQINLTFAYTLKRRFVHTFGSQMSHNGQTYWLFPTPERIASLAPAELRPLQFSTRKAEYMIGVADLMAHGELSKAQLLELQTFEAIQQSLVSIRGVGRWTANYVLMRCLRHRQAFPIDDVGLHNALKQELQLEKKPTIEEIQQLALAWQGWEAYATFYLWHALV